MSRDACAYRQAGTRCSILYVRRILNSFVFYVLLLNATQISPGEVLSKSPCVGFLSRRWCCMKASRQAPSVSACTITSVRPTHTLALISFEMRDPFSSSRCLRVHRNVLLYGELRESSPMLIFRSRRRRVNEERERFSADLFHGLL